MKIQVYIKSSSGVATTLKVKSQVTLQALMHQFHDKPGTKPNNVKWVVLNLFGDHFDGAMKNKKQIEIHFSRLLSNYPEQT